MATLASDELRHFRLLLRNWTEFSTSSTKFVFCRSENQDGRPGLWLVEAFSTSSLQPLNRIQRNFTGSMMSTSSTKFVFSGRSENQYGHPVLWFSDTSLQLLNVIQRNLTGSKVSTSSAEVVFFRPDADWLRQFRLYLWFNQLHLTGTKITTCSKKFVFFGGGGGWLFISNKYCSILHS